MREIGYRLAAFVGLLVVAAITALTVAAVEVGPTWLITRSPLTTLLPQHGASATAWLISTGRLLGGAAGPLVLAALVLRRSPAAPLGRFFVVIAVLLAPMMVALTLWSLLA